MSSRRPPNGGQTTEFPSNFVVPQQMVQPHTQQQETATQSFTPSKKTKGSILVNRRLKGFLIAGFFIGAISNILIGTGMWQAVWEFMQVPSITGGTMVVAVMVQIMCAIMLVMQSTVDETGGN